MNTLTSPLGPYDNDPYTQIITALRERGYIILSHVFPTTLLESLFIDIKQTDSESFRAAGIGREIDHQLNSFVRRDRIHWLSEERENTTEYFKWMEQLRLRLNRELFLGLFDYECHYAHYPQGAFYKKHLDAFQGNSIRRLTTILYLNPAWQAQDGGELLMYAADGETILETVQPTFGTLVIFLSEEFPHEVLLAQASRYSLTGWFRVNNSTGLQLDPPV